VCSSDLIAPGNRAVLETVLEAERAVVVVDGRSIDERNAAGAAGRRLDSRLRSRSVVVADDPRAVVGAVRRVTTPGAESPHRAAGADR
jgi:hypothetical protein